MASLTAPLITNERAAREWAWICDQVGECAALEAIDRLPGQRRAYPINIARALGLKLPASLADAPPADRATVQRHLADAWRVLGGK